MNSKSLISLLLATIISLTGCATYSSKPYEATTPSGEEAYKSAQRNVYPGQVRQNPTQYADVPVAWAGVVKDVTLFQSKLGPSVRVLIEHRYFDWIEDHGAQPEVFFLSPRGEGEFVIFLKPEKQLDVKEARKLIAVGTMVVAIGKIYVKTAQDKTMPLALMYDYYQLIGQKWYRTDVFDYGREDEPIKKVQGSKFWGKYDPK